MKFFNMLGRIIFSYSFFLIMLFILAIGAGFATFLESIYDTQTAKIFVYDARWYEVVMLLLTISIIGVIFRVKMWKKPGAFILHLSFVVIFFGAFLTRYYGYEGLLHLREGTSETQIITVEPYFQIQTQKELFEFPLALSQIGDNFFEYKVMVSDKELIVKYNDYEFGKKGEIGTLKVDLFYGDKHETIAISGGTGWIQPPTHIRLEDTSMEFSWGSKLVEIPFAFKLLKFDLERYPGSMSASSYASEVEVTDVQENTTFFYRIYMNHPLTYKGFKFFQSAYDNDEKGSIIEVNKDPGKWPTYLGYFLLCVGFIMNFFTKKSRFTKLRKFLQNSSLSIVLPFLFFSSVVLKADQSEYYDALGRNTANYYKNTFGELLIQDSRGRIKPISTESIDILNKIYGKNSFRNLSAEQVVLGMMTNPAIWRDTKIIKITNKEIKEILNLDDAQKYVSFIEMFDKDGHYKLDKYIDEATQKSQSKRTKFDNELIKFDERLNVAYLALKGVYFKFIPVPDDPAQKWVTFNDAFTNDLVSNDTKKILNRYLVGLQEGIQDNQWDTALGAFNELQENQRRYSMDILPSSLRVKTEIFYNHLSLFQKLIYLYAIIGFMALIFSMVSIFKNKVYSKVNNVIFFMFVFAFVLHTIGLILRWIISGHAPWSDSYESLVYIGWSAGLAGIVVFRKSTLALAAAAIMASIVMLVAHMSFINPQITNLVPVLKSYWLTIHVSVITASYGFLGLGAVLGFICLILMIFKNDKNSKKINDQIRHLVAINEISLLIGLSMLTIGNFLGGVWANESWGRYWGWDSKETWSFVSIIVYTLILHLRFIPKLNSVYVFCITSLFGFSSIIMTYFGVNFYLTGMHSYASSDGDMGVPSYILIGVFIPILLSILAYKGRDVKII